MRSISLLGLAICLIAVPVWAGTKEDSDRTIAREAAKQAMAAFNLGHYSEAAVLYERAYKLVPDPILLYDLGQCYRLSDKPDKALISYRSYLRTSSEEAPNRDKVDRMVDDLVRSSEVSHEISGEKKFETEAVRPARTDLIFHPFDTGKSVRVSRKKWAPWVGAGVTVVLGTVAIVEGISVKTSFDSLQATCGKTKSCTDSQLGPVKSKATIANVLWGVTAASAVASGVGFYLSYSGDRGAGISLAWRY